MPGPTRPTHRARWAVLLAALVGGVLTAGAARAEQGVARDIDEACDFVGATDAVRCITAFGVTQGTGAGGFAPGQVVTRGQMATFLARLLAAGGFELPVPEGGSFTDTAGDTHERSIDQLTEAGVASGFPDSTFRPGRPVTRGQMATFVGNALRAGLARPLPVPTQGYFGDDDGDVHERRIDELAELGVVQGVGPRRYGPAALVTRGQMALFLARSLDVLADADDGGVARTGVTDAVTTPELVRAVAAPPQGATTTVTFDFDTPVGADPGAAGFSVWSFAAEKTTALDAARDPVVLSRVFAVFPREAVRLATTATVAAGAVVARDGGPGSESVAGLRRLPLAPGTTAAPDLIGVGRLGAFSVDFSFDEAALAEKPTGYHLVLADGSLRGSASVQGSGDATHVVSFPSLSAADADRVVRAYVESGTVRDASTSSGGPLGPQQAVDAVGSGTVTGQPDLLAIAVDTSSATVRYVFDEPVSVAAPATFRAYSLSGAEVVGGNPRAVEDQTVVVADFPGLAPDDVQGASVDPAAVRSLATTAGNHADEVGVARTFEAGRTAAPDLVSVGRTQQPDGSDRAVLFRFDQRVVEAASGGSFSVYDQHGARTVLEGCDPVEGGFVVRCAADRADDPALYELFGRAARAGVAEHSVMDGTDTYANPPAGLPL